MNSAQEAPGPDQERLLGLMSSATATPDPPELEPATDAPLDYEHLQVCPKCNTTYKSEHPPYCAYDATPLISPADLPAKSGSAHSVARLLLWVLVSITLAGSAYVIYRLSSYSIREKESSGPASDRKDQAVNERTNEKKDLPIVGGALWGTEINLPEPQYPTRLKSEGITGTVMVLVLVNKNGRVISTRAVNGDPRLQAAAVEAAKRATFSPRKLAGHRLSGSITYTFTL